MFLRFVIIIRDIYHINSLNDQGERERVLIESFS